MGMRLGYAGPVTQNGDVLRGLEGRASAGAGAQFLHCALGLMCPRKTPCRAAVGGAAGGEGRVARSKCNCRGNLPCACFGP